MTEHARTFSALGHPGRLAVFRLLMRHAPHGVRPTEIARKPATEFQAGWNLPYPRFTTLSRALGEEGYAPATSRSTFIRPARGRSGTPRVPVGRHRRVGDDDSVTARCAMFRGITALSLGKT